MSAAMIVHRYFADQPALLEFLGRERWQGWGVDGDPERDEVRSRLRIRQLASGGLLVEVARGRPSQSLISRALRWLLQREALEAAERAERHEAEGEWKVEPDLASLEAPDLRLTLQVLEGRRLHAVLYCGRPRRLRFAGAIER